MAGQAVRFTRRPAISACTGERGVDLVRSAVLGGDRPRFVQQVPVEALHADIPRAQRRLQTRIYGPLGFVIAAVPEHRGRVHLLDQSRDLLFGIPAEQDQRHPVLAQGPGQCAQRVVEPPSCCAAQRAHAADLLVDVHRENLTIGRGGMEGRIVVKTEVVPDPPDAGHLSLLSLAVPGLDPWRPTPAACGGWFRTTLRS